MDKKIRLNEIVLFEGNDEIKAKLVVSELDSFYKYVFTIQTPLLYRMKNSSDNKVELMLADGKWYSFYASLISEIEDAELALELLENNNKRNRYRLIIKLPVSYGLAIDARAEGLSLL